MRNQRPSCQCMYSFAHQIHSLQTKDLPFGLSSLNQKTSWKATWESDQWGTHDYMEWTWPVWKWRCPRASVGISNDQRTQAEEIPSIVSNMGLNRFQLDMMWHILGPSYGQMRIPVGSTYLFNILLINTELLQKCHDKEKQVIRYPIQEGDQVVG